MCNFPLGLTGLGNPKRMPERQERDDAGAIGLCPLPTKRCAGPHRFPPG